MHYLEGAWIEEVWVEGEARQTFSLETREEEEEKEKKTAGGKRRNWAKFGICLLFIPCIIWEPNP